MDAEAEPGVALPPASGPETALQAVSGDEYQVPVADGQREIKNSKD